MKKILFLLIFLPIGSFTQNADDQIKQIRTWYKEVESKLDQCKIIKLYDFYDEDFVTGGSSEAMCFYDTINNEIIKIIEETYYDWAIDRSSYYYHDGDIFFVFSEGNSPGEMYSADELGISEEELWERGGEAKTLNYYQDRFYYHADVCIRHLNKALELSAEAEEPTFKEVDNETQKIDNEFTHSLMKHAINLYLEFSKKL